MEDVKKLPPGTGTLQSLTPGSPQLYATKLALEMKGIRRSYSNYRGKALTWFDSKI